MNRDSSQAAMPSAFAHERLLAVGVVVLLPAVVLALTPNLMLQIGMIDPFVYAGLISGFRELTAQFGATYYGNRIAMIDVSRAAEAVFGVDTGYFVVRYVLIAAGCGSLYAIGRRFYEPAVGAFMAVLLAFSPWYLRSLAYMYVDGFAITYLLVAAALLLAPARTTVVTQSAAGVFLALATNTNLWSLAIAGLFGPSWILLNRGRRSPARMLAASGIIAIGFVAGYLALALLIRRDLPGRSLFFEANLITTVQALVFAGGSASYFLPLSRFLADNHNYVAEPLVVLFALAALGFRTSRNRWTLAAPAYATGAALYLGAVIALYLFSHFVLHHGRITLFYYFSYALIPSFIALTALVGEVVARADRRTALRALTAGAAACAMLHVLYRWTDPGSPGPLLIWAVLSLAVLLALALDAFKPVPALITTLIAAVAMPLPFHYSGEDYWLLHSRNRALEEWDVYHSALYLERRVNATIDLFNGRVKFWYATPPPGRSAYHALQPLGRSALNSVQSVYLWGFSRMTNMPVIDDGFWKQLTGSRYLVVLGLTEQEVQAALDAMSKAGIDYRVLERDRFDSAKWSIRFATVELPTTLPIPRGCCPG